jgi:SAM-dependent methyltransferase
VPHARVAPRRSSRGSSPRSPQTRVGVRPRPSVGASTNRGIPALLAPVRTRDGVVVELGCGSGALTRHLVAAGHRVVATDASRAMLEHAQPVVAEGAELRPLVLPDDPLPAVDAVASVGHALKGEVRREQPDSGKVGDDRAIVTGYSVPRPDGFVREITTFVRNDDGTWRRGHERHDNVLMDTSEVSELLARHGVVATPRSRLGRHTLPDGLVAIVGERPAAAR